MYCIRSKWRLISLRDYLLPRCCSLPTALARSLPRGANFLHSYLFTALPPSLSLRSPILRRETRCISNQRGRQGASASGLSLTAPGETLVGRTDGKTDRRVWQRGTAFPRHITKYFNAIFDTCQWKAELGCSLLLADDSCEFM